VDKERDDLVPKKMSLDDPYPKALEAKDREQDENIKRKSKRIRMNMALISLYFGAAIALSLICIIYFSNGAGQILFFSIISLMLTPIYFFNKFWRDELMLR
jgi:1,4-dihydroxy-2-naphthoate octaprenyltransferase